MAAEHRYFYEDEVFRINKKGNIEFGMVLENSECVSSDENSDDEDSNRMKKGHIRVAWHPTGYEEIIPELKVNLADRSLMPGDVVRRLIKGKDTQRGYCRNIHVNATVQIVGTKQVVLNINSKDFSPVEEFASDVAVCLDSWVGTIKNVCSKLHLVFPDGSRCSVNDSEACSFEELDIRRGAYCDFPDRNDYHPGQLLYGPISALEEADWVSCSKELKAMRSKPQRKVKVVVESVETESVSVHWQCRAYSADSTCDMMKEQPPFIVNGEHLKRLKLLNVFESCTLQVGDRNFYTLKEDDVQMSKEQWKMLQKEKAGEKWVLNGPKSSTKSSCKTDKEPDPPPPEETPPLSKSPVPPAKLDVSEWETDDSGPNQDDTASISSGCSSTSSAGGKKKKSPALMTKVLKFKKLRRTRRKLPSVSVKPNTRVVVETLYTSSSADVVWQDGSVETGIPSIQLYPIHHLDDQEFFPGDFVMENTDDGCLRVYGVVQSVDHAGRIAIVNWFHTYTSSNEPHPTQLERKEVSVYDLKDHPDFQYRPGTVAIRVANFEGEDAKCTAGQVLDNYPEGRVHVWWVDGHVSMSWPQDLYKVGDYDSDDGELWDESSEASWETESEGYVAEDDIDESVKPKLAANIEKARAAMSKLEELFLENPSLQTTDIMKKLLDVYKDCRYLDKLMGTSFFHENNFQGLLERVREKGKSCINSRVVGQVSRLFLCDTDTETPTKQTNKDSDKQMLSLDLDAYNNDNNKTKVDSQDMDRFNTTIDTLLNITSTNNISVRLVDERLNSEDDCSNSTEKSPGSLSVNGQLVQSSSADDSGVFEPSGISDNCECLNQKSQVTNGVVRLPGLPDVRVKDGEPVKKEKGTYIFGAMGTRSLHTTSQPDKRMSVKIKYQTQVPHPDKEHVDPDASTTQVCAKLCSLIKSQLVKAHTEVGRRFHGDTMSMSLSNVDQDVDNTTEESVVDVSKEDVQEKPQDPVDVTEQAAAGGECSEGFTIVNNAPSSHKYKLTVCQMTDPSLYFKTIRKELNLLRNSLPHGIWVKGFEDRMDLYSVMIRGPAKTPYEDGLFVFDFQLPSDYPRAPPLCHYLSYCSDRLNPNLYEDGKVCVSLLGTWSGRGTEVWTLNSNLLQVIVSIQGLILVSEPYFNEAGYEKQKGSQQGIENSRMYNEMVILKLVQAMTKLIVHPPEVFREEIKQHCAHHSHKFIRRLENWLEISEKNLVNIAFEDKATSDIKYEQLEILKVEEHLEKKPVDDKIENSLVNNEFISKSDENPMYPEFPLLPASKGFSLSLRKSLNAFRNVVQATKS